MFMTDQQKLQLILLEVEKIANCKHCIDEYGDNYDPVDTGNYDDTFVDGELYGQIEFARELLRLVADKSGAQ